MKRPGFDHVSLLCAVILVSCSSPSPDQDKDKEAITLLTPENFNRTLAEADQDLVFINFWATWCEPCKEEFPELVKLERTYRNKGIAFWAVSCDTEEGRKSKASQFLEKQNSELTPFAINLSEQEKMIDAVASDWQGTLPTTFIFRRCGERLFMHSGTMTYEEFKSAVERALQEEK